MPILNSINQMQKEMQEWRRDLHKIPEIGLKEYKTSSYIKDKLKGWDIEFKDGYADTGLIAWVKGSKGDSKKSIGLRADFDALPMSEKNNFDHKSSNEGMMHACGHDGHTSMLLGAVKYLKENNDFDGTVYFIFQPGEEGFGGGEIMINEGLLNDFNIDEVYALHNWPELPLGHFGVSTGPMMAAVDEFDIIVKGNGSHGARPESGIDPVIISAHIATAAQTIVSRNANPQEMAVLSITQIQSGDAYNVIPHTAHMKGTARTFSNEIMKLLETNLTKMAKNIAEGMGATAEVDFRVTFPPLINDKDEIEFTGDVAAGLVGEQNVDRMSNRITASEDFSYMSNIVPGSYVTIGLGEDRCEVHNPNYDFNDEILPLGATYWAKLVEQRLRKGVQSD